MRTAIVGVLVAALFVGGTAQLVASSGEQPKETKDKKHTYEVLVDGKVVAKGKLASKDGKRQSIEVRIDGDTVMKSVGGWGFGRAFVLGDGQLDPKSLEEFRKQMELSPETAKKLRELTELKLDGLQDGSTFVLPGKGLRLMDSLDESVPTVKFEDDGSYKVLLGGKEIARGKVESKDSRSVTITVSNGDYRVEINGKVVAEGKTPGKK